MGFFERIIQIFQRVLSRNVDRSLLIERPSTSSGNEPARPSRGGSITWASTRKRSRMWKKLAFILGICGVTLSFAATVWSAALVVFIESTSCVFTGSHTSADCWLVGIVIPVLWNGLAILSGITLYFGVTKKSDSWSTIGFTLALFYVGFAGLLITSAGLWHFPSAIFIAASAALIWLDKPGQKLRNIER